MLESTPTASLPHLLKIPVELWGSTDIMAWSLLGQQRDWPHRDFKRGLLFPRDSLGIPTVGIPYEFLGTPRNLLGILRNDYGTRACLQERIEEGYRNGGSEWPSPPHHLFVANSSAADFLGTSLYSPS